MDSKSLMIGDWVTFKDCQHENPIPIKIVAVGYQADTENDCLVQIYKDSTCDIIEIDDEIVGIPLTAEILEKNGFVYFDGSWWYKDFRIVLESSRGVSLVCGRQVKFSYIHELQHALCLCGIEKEIEL